MFTGLDRYPFILALGSIELINQIVKYCLLGSIVVMPYLQ